MSDVRVPTGQGVKRPQAHTETHNAAPSRIRIAERDEEEDLVRICRQLHEENGRYFSFSEKRVREQLARCFNKQRAMIPTIGEKGAIEALGFVSIEQFTWSDDWHLSEYFNYVLPEYRRSQHAKALLKWEKDAADQMGIVLFIGVVSETRLAAKMRLYRRIFGKESVVKMPPGLDVDGLLAASGVAGAYFVYEPKMRYADRVAAEGAPH